MLTKFVLKGLLLVYFYNLSLWLVNDLQCWRYVNKIDVYIFSWIVGSFDGTVEVREAIKNIKVGEKGKVFT